LGLACCGIACAPTARDDVEFRVDAHRLGERFRAPGAFELQAPAGWEALPETLLAEARARSASQPQGVETPRLRAVYRQRDGAALAISEFSKTLDPRARASMLERITAALRERYPEARVEPGHFRYRGLQVGQVMLHDSTRVVFKLLVERERSPLYQLDYVIPRLVYRRELESVESSIGSLRTHS
jgi:hypothetical protein